MLNRHSVDYVDIAPRGNEIEKVVEEAPVQTSKYVAGYTHLTTQFRA